MGSCTSHCSRSECSAVKVATAAETVTDKFEVLPSPIKQFKLPNNTKSDIIKDISVISHHYKTPSGSKDEAFFDSQLWWDSDCEDFVSANGDLTPVQKCTAETPRVSRSSWKRATRRKKLGDLFLESPVVDPSFGFEVDHNRKAHLTYPSRDNAVGFELNLCCLMVSCHSWRKRQSSPS